MFRSVPGKTLLAKAVANQTSATFLRVVGSELIQKYLGDGPKLVRELFRVAEEHAPSIVFIDEIDAIGTKRYEHVCFVLLFQTDSVRLSRASEHHLWCRGVEVSDHIVASSSYFTPLFLFCT